MQVGFLSDSGPIDAVFILRSSRDELCPAERERLCMCFVRLGRPLDNLSWRVLWEWSGGGEVRNTRRFGWTSDESV